MIGNSLTLAAESLATINREYWPKLPGAPGTLASHATATAFSAVPLETPRPR